MTEQNHDVTIAEQVQVMLQSTPDRLEFGWAELGAAALVELALLGRLTSPAESTPASAADTLVVLGEGRTGNRVLDAALDVLESKSSPWPALHAVIDVGRQVSPAVQERLSERGITRIHGRFPSREGYLEILDDGWFQLESTRLMLARANPHAVKDPSTGGAVDVFRNGSEEFSGDAGRRDPIAYEHYPAHTLDTIAVIFAGEIAAFPPDTNG